MDSVACLPVPSYSKTEIFFSPFDVHLFNRSSPAYAYSVSELCIRYSVSELLAHTLIRKLSTVFP